MLLPATRLKGTLVRRYKRFLADIALDTDEVMTVHCPNSGSMRGCSDPGSPVIISFSANPERKYPWTLEMVQVQDVWVGVNTSKTNAIVQEALTAGVIDDFGVVKRIKPEVKVAGGSRLDFCLETDQGQCYLEVKQCSLAQDGVGLFPDAVTARGARHMRELALLTESGYGAAVLYCVQRADANCCTVAREIDPAYALTVEAATRSGVRFVAWQTAVRPEAISIRRKIPFFLS